MKAKARFILFFLVLVLSTPSMAQMDRGEGYDYDEDDPMTLETVGYMLLTGSCIAVAGLVISLVKYTENIGKVIMGIGGFIGIGCVVVYLLERLFALLSIILSFGFKLLLFGFAAYIVIMIIVGIYGWITGK